jgi:hypothetical protein
VTSTSATLNGTVNPNGSATTAHFEFGLSTSYGASTSNTSLGSGTSSLSVQAPTGAIQPGQTFHYRLVATNAAGTAYGNDVTFVTANDAPYALTNAATNVTSNSFQGNATINPNGLSTTSYFQYGLTTNYGSSNPSGTFTGSANLSVSATLNTNIQPNTTYHYRVVASSSAGTTYGNDVVLTTSGGPTPTPTATATATVPPSGSIAITGPAAVSAGGSATYRVLLASGSTQTDVTALSTLSFAQTPPTSAGIGGMGLFISRDGVTGTVYLQARYQNGGTQLTSPAFPVNIVTGLTGSFTANAQFQTGTTYQVSLDASAAGGTPPYTFRWDEDNDGAYQDATGQHVVFTLQSQGGTYSINLEVTDSSGVRMYAAQKLVIAKPPVASEPPNLKFPPDTKPSDFYTIGLGPVFPITPLVLDDAWKARSKNGLIVITHGIRSSAQSEWLATMAGTIRRKSNVDGPNIVLFDWNADADIRVPDDLKTYGADIIEATATLPNLFRPVVEEVVNAGSTAFEFAADILVSRTLGGPKAGRRLADWVLANTSGNTAAIDPSKPIQLIGHSAGGFCMGECAFQLKASGILVDLVTMLDTPMPFAYHINSEKSLGYVDRYISSIYGLLNLPPYIVSVDHYTVAGHYKYSPWDFHFYPSVLSPFDDGHGYSYLWYESTVFGNTADGFSLSPFGGGPRIDKTRLLRSVAAQARVSLLVSESDQAVSGFTGFGNVANTPGGFTLTEQADAGITQQMMLPVGAVSLKFRYRFIAGGDGDVISVNWNDQNALYVGEDLQLSRSDFVEAEVSLSGLSRRDGALSITLVSRGSPNAVVDIEDIRFGMSDDPDADGLSNDQEAALGTDPLRADTDGDGVKDGDEVNVYHTNPLLADTDGDGFSDGDETAAGTNPNDPQSFPRSHSSRLANISTRDAVGTGDNVLIGGFIIAGTQPKTVIVRGLGPSLTAFGISGVLADPVIEVYDSGGVLRGTNDNWKDSATSQQIAASGLAPTNELESALWGVINPGAYTVIVRGKDNSSGIGLFEVYDLDQSVDSRLANISTRGFVQAGDGALIAGSIVLGTLDSAANVLVRAVGPSLTANGVPNALQDPTLEIHDSDGNIVASDDNWRDSQEADIQSTGIPPSDDRESAILLRLSPAPYTAVMRGKDNAVGVGVIEAYHLNP